MCVCVCVCVLVRTTYRSVSELIPSKVPCGMNERLLYCIDLKANRESGMIDSWRPSVFFRMGGEKKKKEKTNERLRLAYLQ